MSKELEALNVLYKIALNTNRHFQKKGKETDDYKQRIEYHKNIIEAALKKEDSIEITAIDIEQENQALCKENKKLKQALVIIKDMFEIWEDDRAYHIRPLFDIMRLKKEEYDLLKEACYENKKVSV